MYKYFSSVICTLFFLLILFPNLVSARDDGKFSHYQSCDEMPQQADYVVSVFPALGEFALLSDAMMKAEIDGDRNHNGVVDVCVNPGEYEDNAIINTDKWSASQGSGFEPIHIIGVAGYKHTVFRPADTKERIVTVYGTTQPPFGGKDVYVKGLHFTDSENGAMSLESPATHITLDEVRFSKNTGEYGAALHIDNFNKVEVKNSFFDDNLSVGEDDFYNEYWKGGAIYFRQGVELNIDTCSFNDNTSIHDGGAILGGDVRSFLNPEEVNSPFQIQDPRYLDTGDVDDISMGNKSISSYLTITNSVFDNNHADSYGGAIHTFAVDVDVESTIFTNNSAGYFCGAACFVGGADDYEALRIKDVIFKNNSAENAGALGFSVFTDDIIIDGVTFEDNSAMEFGGAIYADFLFGDRARIIQNTSFLNNEAVYGGAIFMKDIRTDFQIIDTDFVDNTAKENGGAINTFLFGYHELTNSFTGDTLVLDRVKGKGNEAGGFGGFMISLVSDVSMNNVELFENTSATSSGGVFVQDAILNVANSLIHNNYAVARANALGINRSEVDIDFTTIVANGDRFSSQSPDEVAAIWLYDDEDVDISNSVIGFNHGHNMYYNDLLSSPSISMSHTDLYEDEVLTESQEVEDAFDSASTNIADDPLFVHGNPWTTLIFPSAFNFDLTLLSPAKGAASGGLDMGAYGNGVW